MDTLNLRKLLIYLVNCNVHLFRIRVAWSKEDRAGKFRAHDLHKKHLKADEQT